MNYSPNLNLKKPTTADTSFVITDLNDNTDILDNAVIGVAGVLTLAHGGTAKALTVSNGGIVYSDADSLEILAGTATAQKLLMSQANVAPIWSTPTYPNAGTLGKVIIGDGTNYVESTPTFPNIATGTGKILRADGTNWVASTPTFPNVGTLGKLLIGDGTNYVESTPKYPNASATVGKIIRSDGTDYASSTFTIPDTMAISTILYASAANVLSALATGNSGILVTSGAGVPSIATDIPTAVTIGTKYIYRAEGTDIPVADGGTGLSSIADGSILVTNTADTLSALTWHSAGTKMLVNTSGVLSMESVTGSGAPVLANTPTLITPVLGVATATSIAIGANVLDTAEWAILDGITANKTIDHSAVSIINGNGITGGGTLEASRTLALTTLTSDWDIGASRSIQAEKIIARSNAGLALYEDGGTGIFVKDGGNVGIGTVSPGAKLEVAGDLHFSTGIAPSYRIIQIADQTIVDTVGDWMYFFGALGNGTGDGGALGFRAGHGGDSGDGGSVSITGGNGGGANCDGGDAVISAGSSGGGSGVDGKVILQGLVGIKNAVNESAILDASLLPWGDGDKTFNFPNIDGTFALLEAPNSFTLINPLTTIAESWIGPSSTNGIYFKDDNVGIGTTAPSAKLAINGGVHVGGDSDPGDNNLLVDGDITQGRLYKHYIGVINGDDSANRYEIARVGYDKSNWSWNSSVIIELYSIYWGNGGYKKYEVRQGWTEDGSIRLLDAFGDHVLPGLLSYCRVTLGAPVNTSGTMWYTPIYADADFYSYWSVYVTHLTGAVVASETPVIGQIHVYINPVGSDIASFHETDIVTHELNNYFSSNVGIGTPTGLAKLAINGGLAVGEDADPGDNNLKVVGDVEIDGALNHDGTTVGFYNVTPVTKGAGLTAQLTTVTCSAPGTPDYAIADPVQNTGYGFSTSDEMLSTLKVIANLQTRIAELEARLGSSTGVGLFT